MKELTLKNVKPSKRYAQALFEAMQESNFDEILFEFNNVVEIINKDNEFKTFLSHPVISNDEKKQIVSECFKDFSDTIKNFLFILIDEKRINCLSEIKAFLDDKINGKNNLVNVNVTLAFEANDEIKNQIIQRLKNKLQADVSAEFKISPDIIGGLKIQVEDTVIDLSIKKKIENFKKI